MHRFVKTSASVVVIALFAASCINASLDGVDATDLVHGTLAECDLGEEDLKSITLVHIKSIQAKMMFGKDVPELKIEDFSEELSRFKSLRENRKSLSRYHSVSLEPSKDCTIRRITSLYNTSASATSPDQYALKFELK